MSVFQISYNNFKNNIKVYTMFFISMVFSVVILSNFMILMDGNALKYLGDLNEEYTKLIIQMLTLILVIFMFFFIWYSSNVFLRNRKKEIGIYTFMGLDSTTIGRIYFIEIMLIGLSSCLLGTGIGIALSKFFQIIVFKLAEFDINVTFNVTLNSIVYTVLIFLGIFLFMSLKGFISIIRSNVIDLLNDSKKTEKMPKVNWKIYIISFISLVLVIVGYYLILKDKMNAFTTLLLVCVGTYGLFGTVLPVVFNFFIKRKSILYNAENIITINNLAYRLRKNYTTYATIAILTACTVTVLGTSVAMKASYDESDANNRVYSLSFSSSNEINNKEDIKKVLSSIGEEKYELSTQVLKAKSTFKDVPDYNNDDYIVLSYNQLIDILKINENADSLSKISEDMVKDDQVIFIQRPGTIASLRSHDNITVNDMEFKVSESRFRLRTLGSGLNYITIVVNDENYEKIKTKSELVNFYGIKIDNEEELLNMEKLESITNGLSKYIDIETTHATLGIYESKRIEWMKGIYAIGAFLFLVFILAEASIIYIKIYSDAKEDKSKYKILLNIGASNKELRKSINKEVALFYVIPVVVGLIHSYFAIRTLGDFLSIDLKSTYIISVLVSILIFGVSAVISMKTFKKIVQV